jgi:hypothetical protein
MTAISDAEKRSAAFRALDAFLVDNPKLEQLSARLARFNVFRVLGIERAEIRHSNVLAWLLNPRADHGLGMTVLRRFLSRVLLANTSIPIKLTPARVELQDFNDVEVYREWHGLDVFVFSRKGRWSLAIENKIGARESAGQLRRYRTAIEAELPGIEVVPVLLTLDGEEPSEDGKAAGYVPWEYESVSDLVEEAFQQNRTKVPADAAVLIAHYLETLGRLTMADEELVLLCKDIYRKHRDAIKLINEYGTASLVIDACERWVRATNGLEWLADNSNRVWFLSDGMAEAMPRIGSGWGFLPRAYPVCWWLYHRPPNPKLQLTLEVGPIADSQLRLKLLAALQSAGFKFWEGAMKEGGRYTRIHTASRRISLDEDGEIPTDESNIAEVANELWRQSEAQARKVVEVMRGMDWGGA